MAIVDCDADPFVPDGWTVEEHRKGGQVDLNNISVELYLSKNQQGGKRIEGNALREELADKPVCNAKLLDFNLAHPELIPEEWKGKYILFWGTIYRDSGGFLCVRILYWSDGRWDWSGIRLVAVWGGYYPAAVSAGDLPESPKE
jgi:hypothetical protein